MHDQSACVADDFANTSYADNDGEGNDLVSDPKHDLGNGAYAEYRQQYAIAS